MQRRGDRVVELAEACARARTRARVEQAGKALRAWRATSASACAGRSACRARRFKPRSSARPAAARSSGAETAAARCRRAAAAPRSPSHFSSALPPSETPTAQRPACARRRSQDPVDLGAVAGVVGARQAVQLARAAAEMRHHAAPAALRAPARRSRARSGWRSCPPGRGTARAAGRVRVRRPSRGR